MTRRTIERDKDPGPAALEEAASILDDADRMIEESINCIVTEQAKARLSGGVSAPVTRAKVGRNDPCPCGSGKKYKNCCGKV